MWRSHIPMGTWDGCRSLNSISREYLRWPLLLIVLVAITAATCFGFCNCSAALEINGVENNLRRLAPAPPQVAPEEAAINTIDVSNAPKEALVQHATRNNRSLIWRNYTAISGYSGPMDEEFLQQISLVWLLAEPPTPKAHRVMAYLYILMMTVGFVGNAFVLFMFFKCRSLRTPANTFVMNLAISDWLMMTKIPIIIHNSFHNGPALGSWGCQAYGFVGALSGTLSITTLTAIAIDRFNVILYPLNPNRSTTHMKARLMILFCWCYSLFFSSVPLLKIFSSYVPEGYLTCCSFDYLTEDRDSRIFMFCYFVFAWCVPFVTIAYCYSHILHVVISANSIQSNKDKTKQELKLAAVVFSVIALWFVAWTPYAIVALIGISRNEHLLTPLGSMLPAFFAKGAALINPYVYAVTHPRFRMEFKRMFLLKSCPRPANFTTSMATRGVAETNIDAIQRQQSLDGSIDDSVMS